MANYITTLENSNEDVLLPRTKLEAISDSNGNYLDNQLTASNINALKELTVVDILVNENYSKGSSSWVANNYQFDTNYRKFILNCQCLGGTRDSIIFDKNEYNAVISANTPELLGVTSTWDASTSIMTYINGDGSLHVDTRTSTLQTRVTLVGLK